MSKPKLKFVRNACFVFVCIPSLICIAAFVKGSATNADEDSLAQGFQNPPAAARPRVWWHWMNGNITKVGIQLDLEWMHRIGLAGVQTFDAALATPQVVDKRLVYMSPEWKEAYKYSLELGEQLHFEQAIASSAGWSETGGPWVPPSQGMKKYVWSETIVEGGHPYHGVLNHPPTSTGAFQDLGTVEMFSNSGATKKPEFYADASVVAFRRPAVNLSLESLHPKVSTQEGPLDATLLSDGDLVKTLKIPVAKDDDGTWIKYEFASPERVSSVTLVMQELDVVRSLMSGVANPQKLFQASDDGMTFRDLMRLPEGGAPQHTSSFAPVTARYFRLLLRRGIPPKIPLWLSGMDLSALGVKNAGTTASFEIAEFELHAETRVNRFEEKAAFTPIPDLYPFTTPPVKQAESVRKSDVVDLTSRLHADGTLDWTPPKGTWVVLRLGYSLLGITNHPATEEATGLEVDKLNHEYVRNYMNAYLDSYKNAVGGDLMGNRGIRYVVTDSWEAGSQNWTDNMMAEFKKLRGYDSTPWLPVLAGQIVESSEASDRFLWDFRKTIADLIANEHYGQVQASLKERGIGHYGESHEDGRALVADGMEVKKLDDIPMSAMWVQAPGVNEENYNYNSDDRESASVAHIYGQNIAAAESFTAASAPWAWSPGTLKPTADQELLNGINRFVIHESAHQPLTDKAPGLTLGPFGQWFNRNETWAEQAGPWIDYLSRSSYLLQQGHFAADMVYFYGEDSNLTALFHSNSPELPSGHAFDYINADALIHELRVKDGRIVTASGMNYRLLGLDPYSRHMSLPVLRAIHKLVLAGATVAGAKPTDDPSLVDDQAEFHKLADELFGSDAAVRNVGKGTVYPTTDFASTYDRMQVPPDFSTHDWTTDKQIPFVHRKLSDGDLYFVDNRSDNPAIIEASFRVTGKAPEIWHAETGKRESASYRILKGSTTVPLRLEPWGAEFVVFRQDTRETSRTIPQPKETQLATVDGPWKVSFQPNRGAPPAVTMDKLIFWNESTEDGIKYFSGTATYKVSLQAQTDWFNSNTRLLLDLGDVRNLGEVLVNGKSLGVVWHAPYRIEVTHELKPGPNEIVIKATNAWVNRMIGDQQPGVATKYTFADVAPYKATSKLLPSGLLGPVEIISVNSQ